MPSFFSDTFSHSASNSFGVVKRQRMLSCARKRVRPCSTTCCLYCSAIFGCPIFNSLITQRGSRSIIKQMPPRNWARCSTAKRNRRGPVGPRDNQSESLGKYSSGKVGLRLRNRGESPQYWCATLALPCCRRFQKCRQGGPRNLLEPNDARAHRGATRLGKHQASRGRRRSGFCHADPSQGCWRTPTRKDSR